MKNLIITGGLGFIGKNYYLSIRDKWEKIIIIDKVTYAADYEYFLTIKREKDEVIIGDITDIDFLEKNIKKESIVIHFAAESHVDNSFKSSLIFSKTNSYGTHTLLEVCRNKSINKFIMISTDEVYGESSLPCNESSPMAPSNPYAASKAGADLIAQSYYKSFNVPIIIVRPNNLYGPRQNAEKIIPAIIRAINGGKKLSIHGKGETSRFFLHVNDFNSALNLIIKKGKNGEIFNINGSNKYKIIDLISEAANYKGISINNFAEFVKDRPFNDQLYVVNGEKIKSLGWIEKENFIKSFFSLIDKKSFIQ